RLRADRTERRRRIVGPLDHGDVAIVGHFLFVGIGFVATRGQHQRGARDDQKLPHQCLPKSFSTSLIDSLIQVGRPWLHWPERGVRSISRSSAFISVTVSERRARTDLCQAIVASTCSIRSASSRLSPCCARSSARSRSSAWGSASLSAPGSARTSNAPGPKRSIARPYSANC